MRRNFRIPINKSSWLANFTLKMKALIITIVLISGFMIPLATGGQAVVSFIALICSTLLVLPSVYIFKRKKDLIRFNILSLIFIWLGVLTAYPLKFLFWVYSSKFENYLSQAAREDETRIGIYNIKFSGYRNGTPFLARAGHKGEIEGFVKLGNLENFNADSSIHLSGGWVYLVED
jgi:hypothetical protein